MIGGANIQWNIKGDKNSFLTFGHHYEYDPILITFMTLLLFSPNWGKCVHSQKTQCHSYQGLWPNCLLQYSL